MAEQSARLTAFGERLRATRLARGWTQEELGRRTGRHWTYIGGLERGERNPSLVVICELAAALSVSAPSLLGAPHPVCEQLGASSDDILDALANGFRARIDVKGKLAELYMYRRLEALRAEGALASVAWQDADGKPDFVVSVGVRAINVECKNVRSERSSKFTSFRVELQRTRNSKDGALTRAYRATEFDVLGVALFNQTNQWDFLYTATRRLARRPENPELLVIMQRVPLQPAEHWYAEPLAALRDALGGR